MQCIGYYPFASSMHGPYNVHWLKDSVVRSGITGLEIFLIILL